MPRRALLLSALLLAACPGSPDSKPPAEPDAGAEDAGQQCGAGTSLCAGSCVDLLSDPSHCGGCDRACPSGQLCEVGTCTAVATCRESGCPDYFYCDAASGTCQPGCTKDSECTGGRTCATASHSCECPSGTHLCSDTCVSDSAITSCGALCTPCEAVPHGRPTCDGISCGRSCNTGYHLCGDACVSNNAVATCGQGCTPCPIPANGSATCDGSSCGIRCNTGFHLCNGACVSNTSVSTCGSRCTPCPVPANGSATCDGSSCGIACNTGFHDCSGSCVSSSSPQTCGNLCTACPTDPHGDATCVSATCGLSCDSGYRLCDGTCALCPSGFATNSHCEAGQCVACQASERLCQDSCASCPTTGVLSTACDYSRCVATACAPGFHPCSTGCCDWTVETVDDGSASTLQAHVSLQRGTGGAPHLAYATSAAVRYARHDGSAWQFEDAQPTSGRRPALVLVSGNPAIAFESSGIKYATRSAAGSWTVTSLSSGGSWPTLFMGGSVFFYHYDYSYVPSRYLIKNALLLSGSQWTVATVYASTTFNFGSRPSATTGSSYGDVAFEGNGVSFVRFTGSQATSTETVDSTGSQPAIATDRTGHAVIAYLRDGGLALATKDTGGWTLEQLETGTEADESPAIVAERWSSDLHVAYYCRETQEVRYGVRRDGVWSFYPVATVGTPGSGLSLGRVVSLALDSASDPAIAFYDFSTGAVKVAR